MDLSDKEIQEYLENDVFPKIRNTRMIDAAMGKIPDKIPVWIMRQVGTYMPEYQDIKKDRSYSELIRTPKLACEATIMQIKRYDLDAAFLFSDILVVAEALGIEVDYTLLGPIVPNPLTLRTLKNLDWNGAAQKLTYVGETIKLARHKLEGKAPIIAYAATPWTLMVYMIEGSAVREAPLAKKWLFAYHDKAEQLLENLKNLLIDFIVMQVKNGASIILLFEKVAEHIDVPTYKKMVYPKVIGIREGVLAELKKLNIPAVPFMIFGAGSDGFVHLQLRSKFEVVGVDWIVDPSIIRQRYPNVTLQANMHPLTFACHRVNVFKRCNSMFSKFGYRNTIVNLGCSIFPHMTMEAIEWCIEILHARIPA